MSKHLGRRERVARKRRSQNRRTTMTMMDATGVVTLKLGRKKSSQLPLFHNKTAAQLKKKFRGCVVDAE